jgi:Xaa-Pro aminopeptidase
MIRIRLLFLSLCLLPLAASPDSSNFYFAARRETLMKEIRGSLALVAGAAATRAYEPFRQGNDFYYLSGVETPGAFLLLDAVEHKSVRFLPARNRLTEAWEGPQLHPGDEARKVTGFDDVLDLSAMAGELERRKGLAKAFYVPTRPEETAATSRDRAQQSDMAQERSPWDGRPPREKALTASLKHKLGDAVEIRDLSPLLDRMRRVKDAQEVTRLRESGRISALGIAEAIRATRPGDFEYQIGAVAEFVFKWNGSRHHAYFPIVGSGPNSCILHYSANTRRAAAGDIVVMDFGADYLYYHSDITRTFPVSGRFTEEQASLYRVVLEAQKAAVDAVRPGATFQDITAAARTIIDRHGYGKYWRHGVSHYIGLSTHDVGPTLPFEAGVVLTVEPGLYLEEKSLGVRIEDTVLVTAGGHENLTEGVPKEIGQIEALMTDGKQSALRPR